MSGLEIAGVVLGVIPLFISAFEHYEEGLRPLKAYARYRQELSRYRGRLLVQNAMYTQTLEELLADIVEEEELKDMITEGYSTLWQDQALDIRLKKRLGRVYEAYHIIMTDMRDVMEELANLLDIQRQGNVTGSQLEALLAAHPPQPIAAQTARRFFSMYEFKKKLKFGFKSGDMQPLLEQLEQYNEDLHKFTEKSKKLENTRSINPRKTFTKPIHRVRDCAERLHKCLGGAWTCPQHTSQVVNLLLESRVANLGTKPLNDQDTLDEVVFSLTSPDSMSPCIWRSLQVHVFHEQPVLQNNTKVSFAKSAEPTAAIDISKLQAVDCLCTTLASTQSPDTIGLCLDHREKLLSDYPITQSQRHKSGSAVTLNKVLSDNTITRRRKPFSSKQSYLLGLTLASSFLQLRATPWLSGSWRADDIHFIHDDTNHSVDFDRPYIQQTYTNGSDTTMADADDVDDNCSFLNLGIMLLEIFFKETLEQHRGPGDLGSDRSFVDLQTARRWVQLDKEDMSVGFHQAVTYCISCFANPNVDLQDSAFRQTVVDQVITPLKEEWKMWHA